MSDWTLQPFGGRGRHVLGVYDKLTPSPIPILLDCYRVLLGYLTQLFDFL